MSRALATIALLILSNTFMTLAWYGHIAFKSKIERFGMLSIILLSWGIALFEYCFQVPANRIGSSQLGGPFSIWELKVIQEVISLLVFTVFAVVFMKSDTLRWNHLAGFVCLILAVYFIFRLILGMMFSSGVGAVVQILQYLSNEAALKSFVVWTMGSLGDVTLGQLGLLLPAVVLGLVLAVAVIKPLNLLLLGENYARTMGLDIRRSRQLIFLSTTLLAGTVTAFCGPIGFIGLAVPHVARILFADADHRILVPASILTGIVVMLLCDVLAKLLTFPINTITALLGIPIVIWVVIRNKSIV
ncbi:iron chelate uptake ABC transporter family permease subunit [Alistipes putredinis]|uniref:iron chelate uptake ABC transporter family permease subunit n=2 Tax=Alistipes putredinis TaxID=28117 RepID=UPI003AB4FBBC